MRVAQINIQRSLPTKINDILALAQEEQLDVIAICETGLCNDACYNPHVCTKLVAPKGWRWIGEARNVRGGGVGFLIREGV